MMNAFNVLKKLLQEDPEGWKPGCYRLVWREKLSVWIANGRLHYNLEIIGGVVIKFSLIEKLRLHKIIKKCVLNFVIEKIKKEKEK